VRRIIAIILALAASIGLAVTFSPAAFADGDPASDVLVYEPVFNPYDSGATVAQAAQLEALVRYVSAHGYPVKVAMIASSRDLGTASELWENPDEYAIYLGTELKLVFKGRLLVVMPQGYGLRDPFPTDAIPAGDRKAVNGLYAPGSDLVAGAYQVVTRLASDNGITVPKTFAYTAPAASSGSSSASPLIGFAVGLVAIAVAWGVSLRARPLRTRAVA
jgi:hypothetical protein